MNRRHFLQSGALGAGIIGNLSTLGFSQPSKVDKTYVRETDGIIRIGNDSIELTLDLKLHGAPVSLRDKTTSYEFIRDHQVFKSLFRLALRQKKDRKLEWFDSRDAGSFHLLKKEQGNSATLVLEAGSFSNRKFSVQVEVTIKPYSSLSTWHMRVTGLEDESVYQFVCPILSGVMKVGEGVPGETLAVPRRGEGFAFKNPYPVVDHLPLMAGTGPDNPQVGMGEVHGKYPGSFSVQFMLYYNDHAGLYVACHDSEQNVKGFDVGRMADWGSFPVMSISHCLREAMGQDAVLDYDTVVGVFHGDWYDGADIYKAWATQQWWCAKKLWDRDIADWLRTGVGVFQMSNYHIPTIKLDHPMAQIAEVVNGLSRDIGVPLLALVFNFEGRGGWTGPVGLFPPREGEAPFREAMRRLREAGNYGFVYIPGGNWYIEMSTYSPRFNSWAEFEVQGRPNAIIDDQGKVEIDKYFRGWQSSHLCPHTTFTQKLTVDMVMGALDRGCTVVQIDNFPGIHACFSTEHGHPPGFGSWWSEDWKVILTEVRRQAKEKNSNCAFTSEGISENVIPYIDMFDQRAGDIEYEGHWFAGDPMGGETIPVFKYVYSQYISAYQAAFPECNRPEILYWTRSLGKSLAQGLVPTGGWYFPEPRELNPITIGFYKKVVHAAARDGWKYLVFGQMLRPPKIHVPKITASYLKAVDEDGGVDVDHMDPGNRHVVQDYAVQHSTWRSRDGMIGYFFANVSQERVEFTVDLSSYSPGSTICDVDAVTDGKRTPLTKHAALPSPYRLRMEPLSVTLLEVKPTS